MHVLIVDAIATFDILLPKLGGEMLMKMKSIFLIDSTLDRKIFSDLRCATSSPEDV